MIAEEYLGRSRLFRRLKSGPDGQLVEVYAARLVKDGLARHGTWRCLNLVGDLLSWIAGSRSKLTDLDERMVERYLRYRGGKQSIQPGDRAALKRWLSVLRDAGSIAPAALPPITSQDQIFEEFGDYLRRERGLAPKSIVRHQPFIRRFLHEVCPAGVGDLGRIRQEDVIRYIERHARDWSAESGKAMCWSLRAFLRYLHHQGAEPARSGRLRALDQAMEAREPADLSLDCAGSEGPRWLRPNNRHGAAGLRHLDDAGQARLAGRRSRDAHPGRCRLAIWRDARSRQGSAASEDADPTRRRRGRRRLPARWSPQVVVSPAVSAHAGTATSALHPVARSR